MRKFLFLFFLFGASPLLAQTVSIDLGDQVGGSAMSRVIQLIALLTVISLAPSLLMMVTSFTRIIVVLSLLRSAIGIQQTPPNTVLIGLALFLTAFVMAPTFKVSYEQGFLPLAEEKITEKEAYEKIKIIFFR
jgi:flagellar biosynthetic protein FliP